MKRLLLIILVLGICISSHSQTATPTVWLTIATAGQTVYIPSGSTVRYGSVADNLYDIKAYPTAKQIVVGSAEYTINPDPKANASTFVLQVEQTTLDQPGFIVNGNKVDVPAPNAATGTEAACDTGQYSSITYTIQISVVSGTPKIASHKVTCQ